MTVLGTLCGSPKGRALLVSCNTCRCSMYCFQKRFIMEGLLPYSRGLFYHLPVTSAQLNTWHPHIYEQSTKNPTPFFITNILDLGSDTATADKSTQRSTGDATSGEPSLSSKALYNASRLLSGSGHYHGVVVRVENGDIRAEKDDEVSVEPRGAQSPYMYQRDRVESPQEGKMAIRILNRSKILQNRTHSCFSFFYCYFPVF